MMEVVCGCVVKVYVVEKESFCNWLVICVVMGDGVRDLDIVVRMCKLDMLQVVVVNWQYQIDVIGDQ